jgi:asparagine synthase (glutamine-hydrolysing)
LPGLHLIKTIDKDVPIDSHERLLFENTLSRMRHFQWYVVNAEYVDTHLMLGRSYYEGYPFTVFQSEKEATVIDGAIYNKSQSRVRRELDEVSFAELSFDRLSDKIKEFVCSTHGEFVIVKYDKLGGNCVIFNDALGRLPLYYCSSPYRYPTLTVISREPKFIMPFLGKLNFDLIAVAEYLLFGYSLSTRTLWKDIKRLPPATMLMINTEGKGVLSKQVFSWNLDPENTNGSKEKYLGGNAKNLVNLFRGSVKDIAKRFSKDYAHVVALSGGLDSRATLAGLCDAGVKPIAISFPTGEYRIARKIAQSLKVNHYMISPSFKMLNKDYVKMTDGLANLGALHILSYMYEIREKTGNKAVLYTGDGGDKTLSPLGFKFDISNVQELVSYLIETDHVFDLGEISLMLNIRKETLREHLENYLMSYPEKTMEGKFAHFRVFERGFKWLFIGEDRNRLFMWSTTPFYSINFFKASMKESQKVKNHFMLYKSFLSNLNPILPRIQYYDRLIPLSLPNWLLKSYLTIFEWLKKHFYVSGSSNLISLFVGQPKREMSDETKKLMLQLLTEKDIFDFLDSSKVGEKIISEKNQIKLNVLATLILHASVVKSTDSS